MDYTPLNRHEKYLNAIRTNNTTDLPTPITREEKYLSEIAMNSGGGGGASDAVKYTEQSLTSAQQAQARENIGAAASTDIPTDAVKYTAQTLTDAQKTQARTNIGAGTSDFSGSYSDLTNAPPLAKGNGTGGNTVGGTSAYATYSNSFAYGTNANAIADHALAFGLGVNASHSNEVAFGKYNISSADTAFSIGDGAPNGDNHNLMELKTDGRMFLNGNETAIKNDVDAVNKRCDDIIDIISGKPIVYGFHVNPDESDPADAVTYLADAVGMTPAAMGATTFNYGSWKDAFFMPRPCMLKFDGSVDYYLDPNDYSKKLDGTASDISNYSYNGNAMMEFPLIWYKFEQGVANGEGYFYVSNQQVDNTYKCWSNMDCDGNIIDHFYMPIYNGCTYDGKMRSISGITLDSWSTNVYSASATYAVGDKVNYNGRMWKCITAIKTAEAFDPEKWEQFAFNGNTTGTEEITQATANNTTEKTEWYIDQWCDRVLINGLLVLISKSIDTQGSFGRGIDSGSQAAKESYVTGSLNDKGLFYGSTANGNTAVKVFGMENWWALAWHRTAGLIGGANNTYLYKLTASTADGSTASAYNTNGSGYLSADGKPTSNNYVKQMKFGFWGWLPFEVGAYSTQYYKDYYYNGTGFALVGGGSTIGAYCGAFSVYLSAAVSHRYWDTGAAPSCKPLANKEV